MSDIPVKKDSDSQEPGVYKKAVRGGAWMLALRLFNQAFSIAKKVVLARLLMPADFGLFTIATITLTLTLNFTQFNFNAVLIHKKKAEEYLDAAWTMGVVRGMVLFVIIFLAAPFVVNFFDSAKPFEAMDISRPGEIVDYVVDGDTEFSAYLAGNLSEGTITQIGQFEAGRKIIKGLEEEIETNKELAGDLKQARAEHSLIISALKELLAADMSSIIQGGLIYSDQRFSQIELSDYAKELIADSQTEDFTRVNKLLLQEVFPLEIKATVFNIPQAIIIIRVIGLTALLSALSNIGTVFFAKNLDFHKKFAMDATKSFLSTGATITLAFVYRNVLALVAGMIIDTLLSITLSYVMQSYRPKLAFNIEKIKSIWQYSRHVLMINIFTFINQNIDYFVVGKILGVSTLGLYRQAYNTGNVFATEFYGRISDVAMPVFAKIQDDMERVRQAYLKMVRVISIIVLPVAAGMIVCTPEIVAAVLGEKWIDIVPALRILCLLGPLKCTHRGSIFYGLGKPGILKVTVMMRSVVVCVMIVPMVMLYGMAGAAITIVTALALVEPLGYYYMNKHVGLKATKILSAQVFPLITAIIVAASLALTKKYADTETLAGLAMLFTVGCAAYGGALVLGKFISKDYDYIRVFKDFKKGF